MSEQVPGLTSIEESLVYLNTGSQELGPIGTDGPNVQVETTQATADAPAKKNGFFQMSLAVLQNIVKAGGGWKDMAAYIVLCSGVNGRQSNRSCTHGAKSIEKRLGITYYAASNTIDWLSANGFIRPPEGQEPKVLDARALRASAVRCVVNDGAALDVAVSRQFVDGIKGESGFSTLHELFEKVDGADEITRPQAVMDALLLFVALAKAQDFGGCAGVDPGAWNQVFVAIDPNEDGVGTEHVVPVPGTDWVMVTVKEAKDQSSSLPFICKVFDETAPDESTCNWLVKRFWHALAQLRSLGLVYRVSVLWQGDPLDPEQRRRSEPIATHYIHDPWAQQIDPYLQRETHRAAWRTETRNDHDDFIVAMASGSLPFARSGRYRYMVPACQVKMVSLVGQLRCRHWAATESTVQGRNLERRRTEKYAELVARLGRQQN